MTEYHWSDISFQSDAPGYVCVINGSSAVLTSVIEASLCHTPLEEFNIRITIYITALTLESNGTVKAIGDNQTVSYSFTPDRSDHLTKYQCVDSKHSSIMVEVELSITYAPAVTVRYTNGTIKCDCDGVPPIYMKLTNETFVFKTDQFPYQRNGRYMCVVSNGIPGTNGKILQNSSIHVNYKGPPVFAKENRRVKIGKVGQSSIKMSFLVYSCPDVEEIFLQKLGRMRDDREQSSDQKSQTSNDSDSESSQTVMVGNVEMDMKILIRLYY
ncbi:unnamed protein product [Mytilus edulis]|uniref:Ig-like domain-containing protein n=1 Tax=Mytilus edulis TaxID=6550 RepID=A0A8S3S6V8_MYTED|nr:unnamed protein product [Mytilus edulis]